MKEHPYKRNVIWTKTGPNTREYSADVDQETKEKMEAEYLRMQAELSTTPWTTRIS